MTTPITPGVINVLFELAARVEAAEGPDRELDCRIWAALGPISFEACRQVVPDFGQWQAPRYTASLDAAMSLVPEGCPEWKLERWTDGLDHALFDAWVFGAPRVKGAATPALALCAASLRARAA